jgi:hypothetical protein
MGSRDTISSLLPQPQLHLVNVGVPPNFRQANGKRNSASRPRVKLHDATILLLVDSYLGKLGLVPFDIKPILLLGFKFLKLPNV